MCAQCRTDSLCQACTRLSPAADELLQTLPTELASVGATVLAAYDDDATTALILRGDAVEQATVRNGVIERWVTYDRNQLDDDYRLRLSASRELGAQVVPTRRDIQVDYRITQPHLIIHSEQRHFVEWEVKSLANSGRSTRAFDTPQGELSVLIADEFPVAARLPEAVRWAPPEVAHATRDVTPSRPEPLVTRWVVTGQQSAVVDGGILDRSFDGATISDNVTPWSEAPAIPEWVAAAWDPVPVVRVRAVSASVEVIVGTMASLLTLGARVGDHAKWFSIATSSQAPAATALARSMGLPDADEVNAFTDPKKITRSTVHNATNVALTVAPAGFMEAVTARPNKNATVEALEAWLPGSDVTKPTLRSLDQHLRLALQRRFETDAGRTRMQIGATVNEVVTVEGGHTWRNQVMLKPGDVDARRLETTTRTPLAVGVIDREGHFSQVVPQCNYCSGKICSLCVDGLVACDCCTAQLCKRCIREPLQDLWLCPACSTMRRPTRGEAREHGRLLSTRKMLIGVDDRHQVVVELSKQHWSRQEPGGEKKLIAGPAVSAFLNGRLAAPEA